MYSSNLDHSEVDEVTIPINTYVHIHEKLTIRILLHTHIPNTLK